MNYIIERTDAAIDDILNKATEANVGGFSHYPGMTYEDGLLDMLAWLVGDEDGAPLGDEL